MLFDTLVYLYLYLAEQRKNDNKLKKTEISGTIEWSVTVCLSLCVKTIRTTI